MQPIDATLRAKGKRSVHSSERGAAFVETALVAIFVLVPLLAGAIDFGRGFYVGIEVANAARAAVQYGSQNSNTLIDTANMVAVAKSEAPDVATSCGTGVNACWVSGYPLAQYGCECSNQSLPSGGTLNSTTCSCPSGHAVDFVLVTTKVTYTPMLGLNGLFPAITLNSQAKMRYALQ